MPVDDVPGAVRDPAHERLDRPVARDDRGLRAEDRAAAPDLHRRPRRATTSRWRSAADAPPRSWGRDGVPGRRAHRGEGAAATAATLDDALELLERHGRGLAAQPRRQQVDLRFRTLAPADQVAARVEIAGPQRWRPDVRAGIDVRGDGSVAAWTGAPERAQVEPAGGREPLRRAAARASEHERRAVAAQPARVLAPVRARATRAAPRSAASGPSPRGGRPRARRRSRATASGASSRRQLNDIAPVDEHDAQRVRWPRIVRPV